MTTILIAEDEGRITAFLEKGLASNGFTTRTVDDGAEVLPIIRQGGVDLLVLDLGLPTKDGMEVLSELRAEDQTLPVIVLTARDDVEDRVAGLDQGADDYLTKPFSFEELLARIRARLRTGGDPLTLQQGDVTLDLRSRRAFFGDDQIELTAREFSLMEEFLEHPGDVLSRADLLRSVWQDAGDTGSNVVDVYVLYLRRKFGPTIIETVRGRGYRLGRTTLPDAPSN